MAAVVRTRVPAGRSVAGRRGRTGASGTAAQGDRATAACAGLAGALVGRCARSGGALAVGGRLGQAVASARSSARLRVLLGSTGMPGPIVVVKVTFFRYRPLAAAGLSLITSSRAAA